MLKKRRITPIILLTILTLTSTLGLMSDTLTGQGEVHYHILSQQKAPDMVQASQDSLATPLRFKIDAHKQDTYDEVVQEYPFDLRDPKNFKTEVEYDRNTGNYLIRTKVGDYDVVTPFSMSPQEYLKYTENKAMNDYWIEKNEKEAKSNEDKFSITDMKFSLGPADKIFGPGGVQIKMQGSAELIFGFKRNFVNNPVLTEAARTSNIPNFEQKISANVTGKVGDKINFGMNYNTEASFEFDQNLVKLTYKGKEDDIIQNLEAGNVSMNLNSSLITGGTTLFGVKTDMQFGKLKVSALASQQKTESKTVSTKGGVQTTPFEIPVDAYDENRHFFLSHYFRDNYELAMSELPYITSGVTINRVEVWITNRRGNFDNARNILAFMDLAEASVIDNSFWKATSTLKLPRNDANTLYDDVKNISGVRNIQQSNALLNSQYGAFGISGGEDYEKIESARKLNESEYTVNNTLGFISLRSALNQDEVLAVAYEYTYGGKTYQVGEFSTDGVNPPEAMIVKLLKSTAQSPNLANWDLMMKNVYSIGAYQMSAEGFQLNIVYQNDSIGTQLRYLTEGDIKNKLLLRVMNLDRLNSKQVVAPDGRFDYVEGYTALSSTGRVIFPVLEPFGSHLKKVLANEVLARKYTYPELYDSTLVAALEYSEKNKFLLVGEYMGAGGSSEIRLNAMNVPRGSVVVTAGGATLRENVDYTVDYMMGTVKILNQSILDSNTNIDVRLENQSMFNMQRKSLFGTHLEYDFNKNFTLGGTIMHLSEMPLTTKVNTGSEPLKNTIWGLNTSWRKESQLLTNILDKIPFVNATQPSSIALNAEFAQLIPGHSTVVGNTGLAYLDDFESTQSKIDVHYPYNWFLASTPYDPDGGLFPEAALSNDVNYGKNRALLAWYYVDPIMNGTGRDTPSNLRNDKDAQSNHLTRQVRENEIFPNKEIDPTRTSLLTVLNLSYYPTERGAYNLDATNIDPATGNLTNPQNRWGGIMRRLETTDFEVANVEYLEFWIMDPFIYSDGSDKGGDLYFNLGDISEDILKDGKKSFEQGLPLDPADATLVEQTNWGKVPTIQSTVRAFDNTEGARAKQDVGLDGLSNEEEYLSPSYKAYLDQLRATLSPNAISKMQNNPFSPLNDPAGDKFHFFRGSDYDAQSLGILDRYKYYNGTEGNSPDAATSNESYSTSSTLQPDIEDINADNTLNEYEKYFQYKVSLRPNKMVVGTNFITDKITSDVYLKNGKTEQVTWYQFKIPVREYTNKIGSIRNFKSIRFMRMFLTGFEKETHLRFGTLDLVRGEWKKYNKKLYRPENVPSSDARLDVLAVNIEENARKTPVNYILPPNVSRQTVPGQPQLLQQNEQAMLLRVSDLSPGDARAVYKTTSYDMRQYKRLQMFVHAESMLEPNAVAQDLKDYELTCFVRLGTDMANNYYEYEVPLHLTPHNLYSGDKPSDRELVWSPENMFDFPFTALTNAKLKRNKAVRKGITGVTNYLPFEVYDEAKPKNKITVVGNPSIAEVKNIMIGVRNSAGKVKSGEVWVNEMRMSEFDEDGGWAAMANLAVALSDLGSVNVSGRMETSGFGGIESNVTGRRLSDLKQLNLSAALDLGRFVPQQAKLQVPAYYTYTTQVTSPKYNPLDNDILLQDALDNLESKQQKDSLRLKTQIVETTESFTISNARVNIHGKKPHFYDPANVAVSYSTNTIKEHSPEIDESLNKTEKLGLNYSYSFNAQPWEPFKSNKTLKSPLLKLIKEFNLYYLPTSVSYNTNLNRAFSMVRLRDYGLSGSTTTNRLENLTFSKDFMWTRQFQLEYKLSKALKFSLQTAMNANIAESYYTPEIGADYYEVWRDTVWQSIKKMGTPYTYQQTFNATWNLPINKLPFLSWTSANAGYNSTYNWNKSAQLQSGVDVGNIAISQGAWNGDVNLNFTALYNKSKYLKKLNSTRKNSPFSSKKFEKTVDLTKGKALTLRHQLNSNKFKLAALDAKGNNITLDYTIKDRNSIVINTLQDMDDVVIKMESKDPNERTVAQYIMDFTVRLATAVKKIRVSYRETNSLTMPGFIPEPGFLGVKNVAGVNAPGWKYVFGMHDENTINTAFNNGWLYKGTDIINPAIDAFTSDFDARATIEPIKGLKIDLTARRQTSSNKTIQYMYTGMPTTFNGTFNATQIAVATAFEHIGNADNNYASAVFDQFLENRQIVKDRLQQRLSGTRYPSAGFLAENTNLAGTPYAEKNGTYNLNSPDVLIPAFLAAYTGRSAATVNTNPFLGLLDILPNWSVRFNGLSVLPIIKDKFRSVTITHAYSNRYTIGNYTSFSSWIGADGANNNAIGYIRDVQTNLPVPSAPYDISAVSMNESFSPLIGVNIAMKNSITAKAEYRKQRNLSLNLNSTQLIEAASNELVVGIGYLVKDFNLVLKIRSNKKKSVKNDLKLNADFSLRDVKTLLRKINERITQASTGNKILSVKFTADYVFSSKINLQLFFDRQSTVPLISSTYPVSSTNFGISFKFLLTR